MSKLHTTANKIDTVTSTCRSPHAMDNIEATVSLHARGHNSDKGNVSHAKVGALIVFLRNRLERLKEEINGSVRPLEFRQGIPDRPTFHPGDFACIRCLLQDFLCIVD